MIRKIGILGFAILLAAGPMAAQDTTMVAQNSALSGGPGDATALAREDSNRASAATGTALLDLFIDHLRDMAQRGTPEAIETRLQELMTAANKARTAKTIDAVFFSRFNRMLAITKLVSTPDSSGILAPVIDSELSDFVQDKLGHAGFREEGGKGPKAINYVATALAEEIIDLQIYLDNLGRRQFLQRKIDERMSTPAKK